MWSHLMHKISLMEQQEWEGILAFLCLSGEWVNNFFAPSQALDEWYVIGITVLAEVCPWRQQGSKKQVSKITQTKKKELVSF